MVAPLRKEQEKDCQQDLHIAKEKAVEVSDEAKQTAAHAKDEAKEAASHAKQAAGHAADTIP